MAPVPQQQRSGSRRGRYFTILILCILLLPSLRDIFYSKDRISQYALNTSSFATTSACPPQPLAKSQSNSTSNDSSSLVAPCASTEKTPATTTLTENAMLLAHQVRLQTEFQDFLHRNQHPLDCRTRRILLTPKRHPVLDGFTLEVQSSGRRLQAALAQDRTFVYRRNFKSSYAPNPCRWTHVNMTDMLHTDGNQFNCLFEPISNCTYETIDESNTLNQSQYAHVNGTTSMQSYGIISHGGSGYFHSGLYGHDRIRDDAKFTDLHVNNDRVSHWERIMGRFWIRAQMVHYLWKPSIGLTSEISMRLPKELIPSIKDDQDDADNNNHQNKKKFIGMHVRYSDNVGSFARDFDRNATLTRDLEHFMAIAKDIRKESGISTVYLATDSTIFLDSLFRSNYYKNNTNNDHQKQLANEDDWTFVIQPNVLRTSSMEWMWFRNERSLSAAGIAADVEILRRADYLIGSFQSNVYRLATELNTAYMVNKYPIHMNRHRTVDVEWYEDP